MQKLYDAIANFQSTDKQEAAERMVMLREIKRQGDRLLDRENETHFTSSAFIVNPNRDKVLMVHHNLRDTWSWPGGHADGMHDLEANARKEIWEETGIKELTLVGGGIASLDLFQVPAHMKHGRPVEAHRHFSVAYIYEADERQPLRVCPEENSQVEWLDVDRIREPLFSRKDVRLYGKLLERSRMVHHEYSSGAVLFTKIDGQVQYVLVRETDGHVGFPKGHIDPGETEQQAALREIWEEVSIRPELIDDFRIDLEYPKGNQNVKHVTFFLAQYINQPIIHRTGEILDALLLPFEEAWQELTYENSRKVLAQAQEYIQSKLSELK